MQSILVRAPKSWVPWGAVAIALPLIALAVARIRLGESASYVELAFALLFCGALLVADFVNHSQVAVIDLQKREVRLSSRAWFFKRRSKTYASDQFVAVASYLTPGQFSRNHLELITRDGTALLLASFEPGTGEAPKVSELRPVIAAHLGINDAGFLGFAPIRARL